MAKCQGGINNIETDTEKTIEAIADGDNPVIFTGGNPAEWDDWEVLIDLEYDSFFRKLIASAYQAMSLPTLYLVHGGHNA